MTRLWIRDARVPLCLLDERFPDAGEGLALVDIAVADGLITAVRAARSEAEPGDAAVRRRDGGQVWPGLGDCHAHLDKGHIWPRGQPGRHLPGGLAAVERDRKGPLVGRRRKPALEELSRVFSR